MRMKKIGGKNFWIILGISIISLIILTIGVIFLTMKSSKEFYSAGYIISSSATKSDKLYFNDNTVYKENVFDEYVFKNSDNKEVSVDKNNFIHYLDNSLSFMKNGVILDLDNINTSLIPYYNITDASIIQYNNGGYFIETADKTLMFGNFLGKITDNKYIVVGKDIKIKLAGSDDALSGNYFEILFVEDGVVKIENQEGSYQTVSEGTIIYVGDKIKINLGDKSVVSGDDTKLTLDEMTIDGDENINITPNDNKVKRNDDKQNDSDGNGQNGTNENGNDGNGNGTGGTGDGNGTVGDGTGDPDDNKTVIKKEVSIDLVSAKSGINTIDASFQVIDTDNFIKGNLLLTLVNTTTGETVYRKVLANVSDVQDVSISSLSPNSNYVMTISEENNSTGIQYFQKVFRTDTLDLKLVREYVTMDTLSYSIDFGSTDVKSVNVGLYDSDNKLVGNVKTIYNSDEDKTVVFNDLTKNTLYNVKVDSVVFNNLNYVNTYTINTSDMTLKAKPILGDISVKVSSDGKEFSLIMDKPEDEDKSITKYTYEIYKAKDITEDGIMTSDSVYKFSSDELRDQKLKLGENGLESNVDYRFRVIVQYNDNYKFNEIDTAFSNYFQIVGKPTIEFTPDEKLISFNQIGGVVQIKDEGCTIPNEGRECYNQRNNFSIKYYGPDKIKRTIQGVSFDPVKMTYNLKVDGLAENTPYTFEVYADIDMRDGGELHKGEYIGSFTAKTTGIKALKMQNWKSNAYSFDTPISVNTEMISTDPSDDSVDKIATITFNLYKGDVKNGIPTEPIGTFKVTENIKDRFYNKEFGLTSNMFGIDNLDSLREMSGGKLNRYYTIEVTDAKDASMTNEFKILDNMYVFETPSILLLEDEVATPTIVVDEITNEQTKSNEYKDTYGVTYDALLDASTIRGYKVTAVFDKQKIGTYFQGDSPVKAIKFYVYNNAGVLVDSKEVSVVDNDINESYFFLGNGTDFSVVDKDMRRGNSYVFSYDLQLDTNNDGTVDNTFPSNKPMSDKFTSIKKDPEFKLFIDSSTKDTITYKYKITDYDNALLKSGGGYSLFYTIGEDKTEYEVNIDKLDDYASFALSNLKNEDIYSIMYLKAVVKDSEGANKVNLGKYYFDGYYDGKDFNMGYSLEYGNFDNRLKIVFGDSDFFNRFSAYLITLSAGNDKYQKVISTFNSDDIKNCGDKNCYIIDYADIANFKGKDITVSVVGFYDTGYIGFSQKSLLGNYFKNLGFVTEENANKVGFVYQNTSLLTPGQYVYFLSTSSNAFINYNKPMGIFGYEFTLSNTNGVPSNLTTVNMVDINGKKFVNYGDIIKKDVSVSQIQNGVYERSDKNTINPKVLDKINILSNNDNFKFTSIIPKVSSKAKPLINGATINVDLSVDEDTLKSDFVKSDDKYKFYIDIYKKKVCSEEEEECTEDLEFIKTINTDYDNLSEVTFDGLDPDTIYYYKIAADMNKNGKSVKTPLFDYNRSGYIEYLNSFKTLSKDDIFNSVNYSYSSNITDTMYNQRILNIETKLKTDVNMNIKFQISDVDGNLKYEKVVSRNDDEIKDCSTTDCTNQIYTRKIGKNGKEYRANYSLDITGDEFVFGTGYYSIKVIAVTTDLGKELELYNDVMSGDDILHNGLHALWNPDIVVNQNAVMVADGGSYKHSIEYVIMVDDKDKVIRGGKYDVELQDSAYNNACPGHEDDCKVVVDMNKVPSCKFASGKTCEVSVKEADKQTVKIVFDNLKADTNYVIYAYANTYRNNINLENKESLVYVRKSQYTKSNLGFSLGAVTPTAVTKNKVLLTFVGAANLNNSLKGIEYSITVQGGEKISSGIIGKTLTSGEDNITFKLDKDNYPYVEIPLPSGKTLGVNNTINITYYYSDKDSNELKVLKLGDSTVFDYSFKNENK